MCGKHVHYEIKKSKIAKIYHRRLKFFFFGMRLVDVYNFARMNPRSSGTARSMFFNGTVLMLNSPSCIPSFFPSLWTSDKFRACADGASNRLFDNDSHNLFPHVIIGDLDSSRPEVLRHFEAQGTCVVRRPDQDSTDMEKMLRFDPVIEARLHRGGATAVLGALGGLLSHQLANLNGALVASTGFGHAPLILLDEREICFVLRPGKTRMEQVDEGMHCALVPLFGPVSSVTTSGLRWNLKGQSLAFGGLVSTSNECKESVVEIETEQPLLWLFESRPAPSHS